MFQNRRSLLVTAFAVVLTSVPFASSLVGCGSSSQGSSAGGDAGVVDASAAAEASTTPHDAGPEKDGAVEAATPFPAFPVDTHVVLPNQGAVVHHPVLVTVSWPGDTNASTWEAFSDALGPSSYWGATTSEYGVGPATSGPANHVRMTAPLPATVTDLDIYNLVTTALTAAAADAGPSGGYDPDAGDGDGGPESAPWPLPTVDAADLSQTVYALFIPPTTTVDPNLSGCSCAERCQGYHGSASVNGVTVPYAVILGCPNETTALSEQTAAHEYIEAATDPRPGSGFVGFDADHLAWDIYTYFNDELGDACEDWQTSYYQSTGDFPFGAVRTWSNAAALAGHDPCVPAAPGVYHGLTLFPSQETSGLVDLSSQGLGMRTTQGFNVKIETPLTFQLGFFSDAALAPWTIKASVPVSIGFDYNDVSNGTVDVSLDKASGENGDVANVTVTAWNRGTLGFHLIVFTWDPPAAQPWQPHYLPVILFDQ